MCRRWQALAQKIDRREAAEQGKVSYLYFGQNIISNVMMMMEVIRLLKRCDFPIASSPEFRKL